MHPEAHAWLTTHAPRHAPAVLEYGSRNVNGAIRDTIRHDYWLGVDLTAGPGVDVVADAARWETNQRFNVCVTAETFEHSNVWPLICRRAHTHLHSGGTFLITCATDPRPPHSALDGHPLCDGEEPYGNVCALSLHRVLVDVGFDVQLLEVHRDRGDLYCKAVR